MAFLNCSFPRFIAFADFSSYPVGRWSPLTGFVIRREAMGVRRFRRRTSQAIAGPTGARCRSPRHTPATGNDQSGSRIGLDASLQALLKNLDL
jgi:hypothetical protein